MKHYSGRLVVRLPQKLHQELAEEAFQAGRSINQLLVESARLRKVVRRVDPWPGVDALWGQAQDLDAAAVEEDVAAAVQEVRRGRKRKTG